MGDVPIEGPAMFAGRDQHIQSSGLDRLLLSARLHSTLLCEWLYNNDVYHAHASCGLQIDVRNASDVQTAYAFSLASGVHLSVKNSGHDYKGRSSGADTLSLWVRYVIENLKALHSCSSIRPTTCNLYETKLPLKARTYFVQIAHNPSFVPAGCAKSVSYNAVTLGVCLFSPMPCHS